MWNSSALANEFAAFVAEQPANRPIDHSEGWSECAIGDFYRETSCQFCPMIISMILRDEHCWIAPVIPQLVPEGTTNTYGELHEVIQHVRHNQ